MNSHTDHHRSRRSSSPLCLPTAIDWADLSEGNDVMPASASIIEVLIRTRPNRPCAAAIGSCFGREVFADA